MSFLKDNQGNWSSKRLMGVIYLMAMLLLFVFKESRDAIIQNVEIFVGMVITGGGLLGIALFDNFGTLFKKKDGK